MTSVTSICVYCASSDTMDQSHKDAARALGDILAAKNIQLVFGGGRVGLMGITAKAVMENGGRVLGYIPEHLHDLEVGYTDITELHVVDTMHTRKRLMFENSDAFVIMPGGLGTLEEFFEVVTWRQIGLHDKPIVIVNLDGFWSPLIQLLDHMIDQRAARPTARNLYTIVERVEDILPALVQAPAPTVDDQPELL